MNWFSMLALCASANSPTAVDCDAVHLAYKNEIAGIALSVTDIDAITRTAYAEASNQGSIGLSAVVFVILNRKISGQFSNSIETIVNAKNQFEPVSKVGTWQQLPEPSSDQFARIETILDLAKNGYLSDPTNGALYFQNSKVVSERARKGSVSKELIHFGNAPISATIDDHTFYALMCNTTKIPVASDEKPPTLRQWENPIQKGIKQLRGGTQDQD